MPQMFGTDLEESDDEKETRAGELLMAVVRQVQAAGVDPETALRKATLGLRDHVLRAEELAGETALAELKPDERTRIWDQTEIASTDE